jgi:hypothetical protein
MILDLKHAKPRLLRIMGYPEKTRFFYNDALGLLQKLPCLSQQKESIILTPKGLCV